jgi:tricorn protease-like protein
MVVVENALPYKSNDRYQMWIGDKVYFVSDRNGGYSLFSFDTKSKKVTELVKNNSLDIKSASAGPGVIAYEQFGSIHLYDLKANKSQNANVRLAAAGRVEAQSAREIQTPAVSELPHRRSTGDDRSRAIGARLSHTNQETEL